MHRGTLFDERYPASEQIPRRVEAVLISTPGQYGVVVSTYQRVQGGSPLTDRIPEIAVARHVVGEGTDCSFSQSELAALSLRSARSDSRSASSAISA